MQPGHVALIHALRRQRAVLQGGTQRHAVELTLQVGCNLCIGFAERVVGVLPVRPAAVYVHADLVPCRAPGRFLLDAGPIDPARLVPVHQVDRKAAPIARTGVEHRGDLRSVVGLAVAGVHHNHLVHRRQVPHPRQRLFRKPQDEVCQEPLLLVGLGNREAF